MCRHIYSELRAVIPLIALLTSLPVTAQEVATAKEDTEAAAELALSNDTLQLRYLGKVETGDEGRLIGGFFLGEERDIVLSAGLLFQVQLGQHFDIGVGPQLYAAMLSDENQDVMAMSLGGEIRFFFDNKRRYAISGQAFYAPDILTFGTADNLMDLSARAEMQISDRVMAFAGMRWFEFDLTDGSGSRTLQEEVFVGLRYQL